MIQKKLFNKTIGILGGMGPKASADFYDLVLEYAHQAYNAIQDTDYPEMIINSIALEGFDETGIVNEALVKQQLLKGLQTLENAHVDCIVMACNTVHIFHSYLQSEIKIPIIHIIEETAQKVKEKGFSPILVLSSETTNRENLYQNCFEHKNINCFSPNKEEQKLLNTVIENVMAGEADLSDKKLIHSIIESYKAQGIKAVVLGCTELPLAFDQEDTDLPLFSSNKILAESVINFAKN